MVIGMICLEMSPRIPTSTPLSSWLIQALEASGLTQAKLAEKVDARMSRKIDRSVINKMTLGKRAISAEEMLVISEETGFPLPSDARPKAPISLAGEVGAGAQIPLFDTFGKDGDGPQVECPPGLSPHGIVAVEIVGDSMEPLYSEGDVLFYARATHDGVPTEAIGRRCVCEDIDGMAWVKQVKPGDEPGTFNLIALNPYSATTRQNVRLKWAAPIKLHWPKELVRKV